jgi:hypothetical protein
LKPGLLTYLTYSFWTGVRLTQCLSFQLKEYLNFALAAQNFRALIGLASTFAGGGPVLCFGLAGGALLTPSPASDFK